MRGHRSGRWKNVRETQEEEVEVIDHQQAVEDHADEYMGLPTL
jgi:hypothetical protein